MKNFKQRTINFLAVIFMAIIFFSCSSESGPILGSWQEYDESADEYILMSFDKDNYFYIGNNGEVKGGKNFSEIQYGVETFLSMTYEIDYTKEPHWIDILMHFRDMKPEKGADKFTSEQEKLREELLERTKEGLRAMGIFEFMEDGKLKLQLNTDAWENFDNSFALRPESFNPHLYSIMEKIED